MPINVNENGMPSSSSRGCCSGTSRDAYESVSEKGWRFSTYERANSQPTSSVVITVRANSKRGSQILRLFRGGGGASTSCGKCNSRTSVGTRACPFPPAFASLMDTLTRGMGSRAAGFYRLMRGHRSILRQASRKRERCLYGISREKEMPGLESGRPSALLAFDRQRLEFLAGLEADGLAGRDVNLLAGAGIPADAGFARFDAKDPKSAELDPVAAAERVLHRFKNRLHRLFSFRPRDAGLLHDGVYDVELDHTRLPLSGSLC